VASGPEGDPARDNHFASPARLLLLAVTAAFTVEMLLMLALPRSGLPLHALLDALVLSVVLLPVLYFCIYRPARRHQTQRRVARDALRESEERYRLLAENATDVIWVSELDLSVSYTSPSVERLRGFTVEEANAQTLDETMPPDSATLARETLARIVAWAESATPEEIRERSETLELELYCKDGSTVWTEVTMTFLLDPDGRPAKLIGITRDITERKRARTALQESERRFRQVFKQAGDAMFLAHASTGQLLDANERASESLGYTREELLGLSVSEIDPGWPREKLTEFLGSLELRKPVTLEATHRRKDGSTFPVEIRTGLIEIGGRTRVFGVARDITERVRAERAAQESTERFRSLSEAAFEGIAMTEGGAVLEANEQLARMLGCPRDELIGMKVQDFVAPESLDLVRERMRSGFQEPYQHMARRKDGSTFPVEVRATSMPYRGRTVRVTALRDITERRKMEHSLRQSEHELRSLFDHMLNGFAYHRVVTGEGGKPVDYTFLQCNEAFERLTGLERSKILGKRVTEVLPGIEDSEFDWIGHFGQVALTGEPCHVEQYSEPLGRWYSVSGYSPAKGHFAVTFEDVTERRRSEEAVRSLRRRVLMAQEEERRHIARELHDELGQALTGVKMDLAWLKDRLPNNRPPLLARARSALSLIDTTLDSVRDLSARLRPAVLDDLGLPSAIEWQARHFARRTGIECNVSIDVGDPPLDSDRATAVFRVLQEALTNVARHAEAGHVRTRVGTSDGHVVLEVRDDGKGITGDQLTSTDSLGLIGMRERAAAFGGRVEIRPGEEGGTAVTLQMPLAGTSG
jgi:PAS domain S-box-containing protein